MNDHGSSSKTMERRSTRLITHPGHLFEALDDDIQVDSEYEQPLTKLATRARKRKAREDKNSRVGPQVKKIRGKRGMLRQLVEMPLDVLFEVGAMMPPFSNGLIFTISSDIRPPETSRSVASGSNHKGSACYPYEPIFHFNLETCPFSLWWFT